MLTQRVLWLGILTGLMGCVTGYAQELTWSELGVAQADGLHEYAVVRTEAPRAVQQAIAEANGAYLATITSAEERTYVSNFTRADYLESKSTELYYWFGLVQDPLAEEPAEGWGWVTGEPFDYTRWGSPPTDGAVGEDHEEDFGAVHCSLGVWNDVPETIAMRAVLERPVGPPPDETLPTVTLDAPVPAALTPPDGRTVSVAITGTAVDGGTGVAQAWLVVDDEYDALDGQFDVTALLGANGAFTTDLNLVAACNAGDADGRSYVISLHAQDGDGNLADPVSCTVNVAPDVTAPVVGLDAPVPAALTPPDGRTVSVAITGTALDGGTGVAQAWLVVDDEYGALDGQFDMTALLGANGAFTTDLDLVATCNVGDADGRDYLISLHAEDAAGNAADPVSCTVSVAPDVSSPVVSLDAPVPAVLTPPDGRTVSPTGAAPASVAVAGTAVDEGTGVARAWLVIEDEYDELNGEVDVTALLEEDGSFVTNLSLAAVCNADDADGRTYLISLHAVDGAGNLATVVSATVLVAAPVGEVSAPHVALDPPSPELLWPPNWHWVKVTISGSVVTGGTLDAAWLFVDDEYNRANGTRDIIDRIGDDGCFETQIKLRAYRKRYDRDGHTYKIWLHATDTQGQEAEPASVKVVCPRWHPDKKRPNLVIRSATPNVLRPANWQYVPVRVLGSATDDWSGVKLVKLVIRDEYCFWIRSYNVTKRLDDDGNFGINLRLRASCRRSDSDGHEYRLYLIGYDGAGNWATSKKLTVRVPRR